MRRVLLGLAVSWLGLSCGCGADRRSPRDAGGADSGTLDAGPPDASAADAGPPTCVELAVPGADIAVDPSGPDTQIHAAAAFDGAGVWIAYNRPEPGGTGNFDVWAVRLACDGEPLHGPVRVNTTVAPNDVDPDLAISDGRLLIAWAGDTGEFPDNLSIGYRVLEIDGAPVGDADRRLVTTWEGVDVTGNHWEPSVAATPDGGFVVAGARAIPAASTFQAFVQPLDADGTPAGETLYPVLEPDVSQMGASVTRRGDGIWLAWTRDDGVSEQAWTARLPGGTPSLLVEGASASGQADLAPRWVAVAVTEGAEQQLHLGSADDPAGGVVLGMAGRIEHSPRVVDDAVAFHRNVSGIRNELVAQGLSTSDTDGVVAGPEQVVAGEVPPYQPAITGLGGQLYLLVWSEGTSPAFRLVARVVRL